MSWKIQINEKVNVKKIINLWISVGWGVEDDYDLHKSEEALNNTSAVLLAFNDKNKLGGMARVLSDNQFHTVLAEIIVHPDFQDQGIGKKLIEKVKEKYKHTSIYLDALPENKKFFDKVGLIERNKMKVYSIPAKK